MSGLEWNTALLMMPLTSDADVSLPALKSEVILIIHCDKNLVKTLSIVVIWVQIYC